MVGNEILQKNEPSYIPGYTGYCPQHQFICGKNYGDLTHELLINPAVNHSEKLILVDNKKYHEVTRPKKSDIEIINSRSNRTDPIYTHSMVSSYDGFIPNLGTERDKSFNIVASEGIASFEKQQLKKKKLHDNLVKIIKLQSGMTYPHNLEERLLPQSKFKLPLIAIRPEYIGFHKTHLIHEKYERPKDYNTSPYFMDNSNPQKYFINGYTGYIPYRNVHYGKTYKQMTINGLRNFTNNYLHKKKTEWASVVIPNKKQINTDNLIKQNQIYKKDTALMPSYTGHVPGAMYKIGKTYGSSSKTANYYIEEQLFSSKLSKC